MPFFPPKPLANIFPGFKFRYLKTTGTAIRVLAKGENPRLLLLHGRPETDVPWHKVASALTDKFSAVSAELRVYGDSSKPAYRESSRNYSSRAMAQDQV